MEVLAWRNIVSCVHRSSCERLFFMPSLNGSGKGDNFHIKVCGLLKLTWRLDAISVVLKCHFSAVSV